MTDQTPTPAAPAAEPAPPAPEPQPPAQPAAAPEQPKAEEPPRYVTQEQLDSAVADAVRNVKMADKQRAKQIKQEIATVKQRLEKIGLQVSPQQEAQLENEIISSYSEDEEPEQQQIPVSDIPQNILEPMQWMASQPPEYRINETDPEFKEIGQMLDEDNFTPSELTIAMHSAVEAKKARIQKQQDKAGLRTPTPGSQGPGTFVAKSASDYRRQVAQERANK